MMLYIQLLTVWYYCFRRPSLHHDRALVLLRARTGVRRGCQLGSKARQRSRPRPRATTTTTRVGKKRFKMTVVHGNTSEACKTRNYCCTQKLLKNYPYLFSCVGRTTSRSLVSSVPSMGLGMAQTYAPVLLFCFWLVLGEFRVFWLRSNTRIRSRVFVPYLSCGGWGRSDAGFTRKCTKN